MDRRKTPTELTAAYAPTQPIAAPVTATAPQPTQQEVSASVLEAVENASTAPPTPITKATGKTRKGTPRKAADPAAPTPSAAPATEPVTKGGGSIQSVMRPDGIEAFKTSLHVPKDVWEDSRRAYVASLDDLADPPTSHSDWVERALWAHLERDPQERKRLEGDLPEPQLAPVPRPVYITQEADDAVAAQASTDRQHGMWRSRSAWIVAAMRVETAIVRAQHDGSLPEAPARLPRQTVKTTRRASNRQAPVRTHRTEEER